MTPALFAIVFIVAFVAFSVIALLFVALAQGMSTATRDPYAIWDYVWAVVIAFGLAFVVACVVCVVWWLASSAWAALT